MLKTITDPRELDEYGWGHIDGRARKPEEYPKSVTAHEKLWALWKRQHTDILAALGHTG